jgi:hypothetical protein
MTIRKGKVNFDAASKPASMSSARARQRGPRANTGLFDALRYRKLCERSSRGEMATIDRPGRVPTISSHDLRAE